ncbi:MAG TPA: polysaccharide biosynthesis/export family protein [Sphingomicrobium sp.]|nr:polysaccharide biosynthesis/export family protein [Sphingomicrobium sp.]
MTDSVSLKARNTAIAFLMAACTLAGCADKRGGPIPYAPTGFGTPDAPSVVSLDAGYKIAPLDTLAVRVFRMNDLTGDYQVDLAGNISMPLIGEVRAVDLTTAQLDSELTRRLGEKYLENPDISVGIKESTTRVVTVDGAVNKAGAYPALGPISLMQAVALAGGATQDANTRRVAVFRQIGGKRQAAAFDLTSIRRGEMEDPRIYSGDIVIVDGSSVKATTKQILNSMPLLSIFRPF